MLPEIPGKKNRKEKEALIILLEENEVFHKYKENIKKKENVLLQIMFKAQKRF